MVLTKKNFCIKKKEIVSVIQMISTIKSQTNHKKTKIHISLSQHLVYIHVHISFISFDEFIHYKLLKYHR